MVALGRVLLVLFFPDKHGPKKPEKHFFEASVCFRGIPT